MLSTKEAKKYIESSNKYLSAGIVEDIDIKEVKFEKSPTGKDYISITFAKGDSTVNSTFWKPRKYSDSETDEDLKKKYLSVISRLQQILEAYYPVGDPATECEVENFEQLANWFITGVNNRDKTKLAKLKLVYNKDGFLSLPTYAKYSFIAPMVKPENWTRPDIEIRSNDLLVRPVVADAQQAKSNPFSGNSSTEQTPETTTDAVPSDMPF